MKIAMTIEFHGPFRVATGTATREAAISVDDQEPLPTESVKGVMRASAQQLLPHRANLIDEVFGSSGRRSASPWHWGSVHIAEPFHIESRTRIAIDPATRVADPGALARTEEVWAQQANFVIRQRLPLSEQQRFRHDVVLRAAASGVHSLGASRRRGFGWVSITPDPPLDENDFMLLDRLTAEDHA